MKAHAVAIFAMMPADFFQFKRFIVHQQKSAMKVTTDACILGAYAKLPLSGNILDIGCGTGLLSLMMAQRCDCLIDAVEPDKSSFCEAEKNILVSAWKHRISIHHIMIQNLFPHKKYDLIICNPPFFEDHLQPKREAAKVSKHNTSLNHHELIVASERLLKDKGSLQVLLPFSFSEVFEKKCREAGLYVSHRLVIKSFANRKPHCIILFFRKTSGSVTHNELIIFRNQNDYTDAFIQLLKPYYLYL